VIPLADIERAVRERRDFSVFDRTHLHRAWREDALGRTRGRDRVRDASIAAAADESAGPVEIEAETGDTIAFRTAAGWRGHRWALREDATIVGEIEVMDGAARAVALGRDVEIEAIRIGERHPVHAPLGELRPGRGQLADADAPILPDGFPAAAMHGACYLHRLWNRRAPGDIAPRWRGPDEAGSDGTRWLTALFAAMPDAVLLFERAVADGERIAIQWRLHGQPVASPTRRIRLIGSSILTTDGNTITADDTLIDTLAMRATAHRPMIGY
jgi:hypothetical protein